MKTRTSQSAVKSFPARILPAIWLLLLGLTFFSPAAYADTTVIGITNNICNNHIKFRRFYWNSTTIPAFGYFDNTVNGSITFPAFNSGAALLRIEAYNYVIGDNVNLPVQSFGDTIT